MAGWHTVTLGLDQEPVFPDRCVVCGLDAPGHVLRRSCRGSRWHDVFSFWLYWSRKKITGAVPICRGHLWSERLKRWSRWIALGALGIAAFVYVRPLFGDLDRGMRKLVGLGIAVALAAVWGAWEFLAPPAFDVQKGKEDVDYDFADADYALDFAELNDGEYDDLTV